jgi:hypothetical protein
VSGAEVCPSALKETFFLGQFEITWGCSVLMPFSVFINAGGFSLIEKLW